MANKTFEEELAQLAGCNVTTARAVVKALRRLLPWWCYMRGPVVVEGLGKFMLVGRAARRVKVPRGVNGFVEATTKRRLELVFKAKKALKFPDPPEWNAGP